MFLIWSTNLRANTSLPKPRALRIPLVMPLMVTMKDLVSQKKRMRWSGIHAKCTYYQHAACEHVVNSVICFRKWIHRPQTARKPRIAHRQTQIHQKGNLFWNSLLGQKEECNCQGMMWLHHSYQKERVPFPSSPNHRQMLRYLITTKHIFQWCSTLCCK